MSAKEHMCDEECICPIHKTPLIYSKAYDDHACQDINCMYGHGIKRAIELGS